MSAQDLRRQDSHGTKKLELDHVVPLASYVIDDDIAAVAADYARRSALDGEALFRAAEHDVAGHVMELDCGCNDLCESEADAFAILSTAWLCGSRLWALTHSKSMRRWTRLAAWTSSF